MEQPLALMLDLNIVLDVVQAREPFYEDSATVLSWAFDREIAGYLAAHAVPTIYYVVRKSAGKERAEEVLDLLLSNLAITSQGRSQLLRARNLGLSDFEDALVAVSADESGCAWIITRNVEDFERSPVAALTPREFLAGTLESDTSAPDH